MDNLSVSSINGQFGEDLKQGGLRSRASTRNLWSTERKLLLALGDLSILCISLALSLFLQSTYDASMLSTFRPEWYIILIFFWLAIGQAFDIYNLVIAASRMRSIWFAIGTASVASVLYFLTPYITSPIPERRLEFLYLPVFAIAGLCAWRYFYATVIARSTYYEPIIILGAGWAGQTLAKTLVPMSTSMNAQINASVGYEILGFVDDDPNLDKYIGGVPVLGGHDELIEIAQKQNPAQIVLAITNLEQIQPGMLQAILTCRTLGIPVTLMSTLYEQTTGKIPLEQAGYNLSAVLSSAQSGFHRIYRVIFRVFDILVGLYGCIITAFIIPFIWIANWRTAPGPLFYQQERVGKAGKTFKIYKFRSMIVDAEKHSGAVWADEDDPRITPVGRFLRKTRLDELPQFWNILRGEMSLIGPRPERPEFVDMLSEEIPLFRTRHAIRPGLTGWAQAMYQYGSSIEDARIKLQYDLFYVKHQGLYLDMKILLKTVGVVIGFKGR